MSELRCSGGQVEEVTSDICICLYFLNLFLADTALLFHYVVIVVYLLKKISKLFFLVFIHFDLDLDFN